MIKTLRLNHYGVVRQYIPKGADFGGVSEKYIIEVEWKLNNRPRKVFGN